MNTSAPTPPAASNASNAANVDFRLVAPDTYEAGLEVSEPHSAAENLQRIVLGPPISETLSSRERLNRIRALAILSSDGLSSVAYGTEASLAVLVVAGASALSSNLLIGLATAALMVIVGASYRQTIHAYPSGGGSYIVARANLGTLPGLIAAASLLVDYLLTVSVSVAAGVDALTSAIPAIAPATVWIDIAAVLLITIINLRGLRESGTIFALPTYLFLGSFGLMIVFGIVQALTHGGLATAPHPTSSFLPSSLAPLTPLLILTAFASGCSAMTGIEAISNGVPAFNGDTPKARAKNAAATLTIMIALLASFFLGTTYLAWRVGAVPSPTGSPTVTAQIASFAFPGALNWLFYVTQIATLLILTFAANTSFNGFPRLLAILSRDTFAPALFSYRGERLAYSTGIIVLGALAALLLWIFQGNVTSLINLYALGVFAAFTLSQTGMVVHWLRRRNEQGWQARIIANGIGAAATAVVTLVIAITKFDRGAWVVLVIVPTLVIAFEGTRHYYSRQRNVQFDRVDPSAHADVAIVPIFSHQPLPIEHLEKMDIQRAQRESQQRQSRGPQDRQSPEASAPNATTEDARKDVAEGEGVSDEHNQPIPFSRHVNYHLQKWPVVVAQELDLAMRIAPEVVLLHVTMDEREGKLIRQQWDHYLATQDGATERARQLGRIKIEVLISPYRTIVRPVARFIRWQAQTTYQGKRVAVLLPRQQHPAWWEWPLQRRVARRVRQRLQGDPTLTIIDIPYTLGNAPVAPPIGGPTDNPKNDTTQDNDNTASSTTDPSAQTTSPDAQQAQTSGEEALGE